MKKVVILVSTVLLFTGLTFGQTPQSKDQTKPATTKTEAPAKKDSKDSKDCEKHCTHKEKSGCCAKKATEDKKDTKTTTPPKK